MQKEKREIPYCGKGTQTEVETIMEVVKLINDNKSDNERKESFNNFVITAAFEKAQKEIKEIEKLNK